VGSAKAIWELAEHTGDIPSFFMTKFGLMPIVARLLLARGIDDEHKTQLFLHPEHKQLHDPFLFAEMRRTVERIGEAVQSGEKLCIYGDYDADGVSSTSLMVMLMTTLNANFEYYIPNRAIEGYGLKEAAIEELARRGVTLIITVDTGISAVQQVEFAKTLGIDVIISDHHEAPDVLPVAYAIINPKQPGCTYPFKGLAGVGVAFKVAHALLGEIPTWALQYAAIGTLADMMPLNDENRVIVKRGIEEMNRQPLPALRVFVEEILRKSELRGEDIGFQLAPRINASGRLDCAEQAVRFLITDSLQEARELLTNLDSLNHERRQMVRDFTEQAIQMVEQSQMQNDRVLVLASEQWTSGVVGIVASKLLETYSKSAIVLSIDTETGLAKGSARSFNGLDMIQALRSMDHLFEQYGGHQGAAGVTLDVDFIELFREKMNAYSEVHQSDEEMVPKKIVDVVCTISDVTLELLEQLKWLEPFGPGNRQPFFQINGLQVERVDLMGRQNEHAKIIARATATGKQLHEVVAFNHCELVDGLAEGSEISLLCKLAVNEYRGNRKPQLMLSDWKSVGLQFFDWRRWSQSNVLWEKIGARLSACAAGEIALFVRHELDYQYLCDRLKVEQIYALTMSRDGSLHRIGEEEAEIDEFHSPRELIVVTMPEQPQHTLVEALRMFPLEIVRIVAQETRQPNPLRLPAYDQFSKAYRWLAIQPMPLAKDSQLWIDGMRTAQLNANQMRFVIDVLVELSILSWTDDGLVIVKNEQKK
jgi:single-stranded-DNA-specific exonuclease